MISKLRQAFPFLMMSFVAGFISAYDNTLNLIFMNSLPMDEQNPVASKIIEVFGVTGLIYLKAATTFLAVIIMCVLSFVNKYRVSIIPVFLMQLLLFYYLTFYTPTHGFFEIGGKDEFAVPFKMYWRFITKKEMPSFDYDPNWDAILVD